MRFVAVFLLGIVFAAACDRASAAVLVAGALGCKAPADASKAALLRAKRDSVGLDIFSKPLVASRSCTEFAKGVTVDVDEKRLPLSCVRLTGDLDCYWVPDALVDLYPAAKGEMAGRKGGGHRR